MGEAIESDSAMPLAYSEDSGIPDVEEAMAPVKGFWRLPPEIRNAIYEELLVTDCAFRLGYAKHSLQSRPV
jgi:hypothetical protein